jgi:hypothetical protein
VFQRIAKSTRMAAEDKCKGELVEGRGAFLWRDRSSYRVKEEDWCMMKEGQVLTVVKKTETRHGIEMEEKVGFVVIKGELFGGVYVTFNEGQEEGVKVKASLEIETPGRFEMEGRRDDGNFWLGTMISEKSYKSEKFIKKHAKDGYIMVVASLEISKEQESIKPAEEKQKESVARDVGRLLGDERTSDYVVECQGHRFACHRAILAARSATFADGLSSNLVEGVQDKMGGPGRRVRRPGGDARQHLHRGHPGGRQEDAGGAAGPRHPVQPSGARRGRP